MSLARHLLTGLCALLLAFGLGACKSDGTDYEKSADAPPFGGTQDVARAKALWADISGYESWKPWPGYDGWQPGKSPHGKALRYFVNDAALENTRDPVDGAIIVKENYPRKRGKLVAVTVMKKIDGYDAENEDWFWVKYNADGSIAKNPMGMKLAGQVAKGKMKGCIACHVNAGGEDFLFIND